MFSRTRIRIFSPRKRPRKKRACRTARHQTRAWPTPGSCSENNAVPLICRKQLLPKEAGLPPRLRFAPFQARLYDKSLSQLFPDFPHSCFLAFSCFGACSLSPSCCVKFVALWVCAGSGRVVLQEITICVQEYRFIASLKKVAGAVSGVADPGGVTNGEVLRDGRKRDVAYLNCQVNMVIHTAEGRELAVNAFNGLPGSDKTGTGLDLRRKQATRSAPNHDVIDSAGEMYARFTSHDQRPPLVDTVSRPPSRGRRLGPPGSLCTMPDSRGWLLRFGRTTLEGPREGP